TEGKGPRRMESTPTHAVAWHPDGKRLASAQAPWIVIYDDKGTVLQTFSGDRHRATCLRWKPDGTVLLSGGRDHALKLWDAKTGALVRTFRMHTTVATLGWSPDGSQIVSSSA